MPQLNNLGMAAISWFMHVMPLEQMESLWKSRRLCWRTILNFFHLTVVHHQPLSVAKAASESAACGGLSAQQARTDDYYEKVL